MVACSLHHIAFLELLFVLPFMPNVSYKRVLADRVVMKMCGPAQAVASSSHEAFSLLKRRLLNLPPRVISWLLRRLKVASTFP